MSPPFSSLQSRRLGSLIAAVLLVLSTVLVQSVPAKAATARLTVGAGLASCPAGYVCLWTLNNYTGTGYAFYNTEGNYLTLPAPFNSINNNSWSFYSHGNVSDVRFYRGALGGDSFLLCRGAAIPLLPLNSDVDPQSSGDPGQGWRDQVTSHRFGSYC